MFKKNLYNNNNIMNSNNKNNTSIYNVFNDEVGTSSALRISI